MKRALAGIAVISAVLVPGQLIAATAASANPNTGSGCTSSQPPTCSPGAGVLVGLLDLLNTGSAK
ncbi:hypothetical protein [Nocardia sp. NPDC050710]|uniref:hypothetical protein n=1 Tax=Nocardia sp. NPDC050710 TaxID=3157220 RepID=UPI00340E41E0